MKRIVFLLLTVVLISSKEKTNYLLKIDPLMQRLNSGNDTTYVVNFWATWCGPCVAELPQFGILDSAYRGTKVKVILMSLDFEKDVETKMIPLLKKKNLSTIEVHVVNETNDNEWMPKVNKDWQGNIPATLIINPKRGSRTFLPHEITFAELDSLVK